MYLGEALLAQGKIKEAGNHLRKAFNLQPKRAFILFRYGNYLLMTGKVAEGRKKLLESVKDDSILYSSRWYSYILDIAEGLRKPDTFPNACRALDGKTKVGG